MKNAIRTLESLRSLLDERKVANLPEMTVELICGTLDHVVDHLKQEYPQTEILTPFDLDEREQRNKGILSQIDTLTDAMQKLKKRFDKAVVKQDYTNELDALIHSMCTISRETTELARKLSWNRKEENV